MRAVGYQKSLPIEDESALVDIDLPAPEPKGRDLLVEIRAVSVNPIDTKVRKRAAAAAGSWKVLGFDAAGVGKATGADGGLFKGGDEVFYSGSICPPGTDR